VKFRNKLYRLTDLFRPIGLDGNELIRNNVPNCLLFSLPLERYYILALQRRAKREIELILFRDFERNLRSVFLIMLANGSLMPLKHTHWTDESIIIPYVLKIASHYCPNIFCIEEDKLM
jgi:hypothetical protein